MPHRSTFPPVYVNLATSADVYKGCPKFPNADVKTIVSVVGNSSIITHICQHAIRHAAAFITTNDLSLADYDRFVEYLRERSVAPVVTPKTVAPDVAGRDKGAGKSTPSATRKRAIPR